MKKSVFILCVLAVALCCSACEQSVPDRPDGTNLEFWLAEDVSDYDFSDYYEVPGWFGAREYYGRDYQPVSEADGVEPEYCVKYCITAWPDYADGGEYVTRIEITDPSVNVYGVTVLSSYEAFTLAFEGAGYRVEPNGSGYTALKGRARCSFFKTEGKSVLSLRAEVTNRLGIVY